MTQRARKRDFRDGSISEFFNSIRPIEASKAATRDVRFTSLRPVHSSGPAVRHRPKPKLVEDCLLALGRGNIATLLAHGEDNLAARDVAPPHERGRRGPEGLRTTGNAAEACASGS
jgi:hypothetical protein